MRSTRNLYTWPIAVAVGLFVGLVGGTILRVVLHGA